MQENPLCQRPPRSCAHSRPSLGTLQVCSWISKQMFSKRCMGNVHCRPNDCIVTSHTSLRSKPVTRLERWCYPVRSEGNLSGQFLTFPVSCSCAHSKASFTPVKCIEPWKMTAVDFCIWASPGTLSRSLSAQAALETQVQRLTSASRFPSARELSLGVWEAEWAHTCCSVQRIHLTSQTGCRFSAGVMPSLS